LARTDQGLFDEAIVDFDDAFRLSPDVGHGAEYAVALFGRGITRRRKGDARGEADIAHAKRLLPGVAELMEAEGVR
jgi:hypothetical protein